MINLKYTTLSLLLLCSFQVTAQEYTTDTCVSRSKSKILNLGMDRVYTSASGPVKSITIENRKWLFDSQGRISEELTYTTSEPNNLKQRKLAQYDQEDKLSNISIYERKSAEESIPSNLISQELYNWPKDTLHLIHKINGNTLRTSTEVFNEKGCAIFIREENKQYIAETHYTYNELGLQSSKTYKYWVKDILKKGLENHLSYHNGIPESRINKDLISNETSTMHYHLEKDELRGYRMDPTNPNDSTHTISKNIEGKIIYRNFGDETFQLKEFTKDGIRYEQKTHVRDKGATKIVDLYAFASNGDVTLTSTKNNALLQKVTKVQTKDHYGNWIKLVSTREKPKADPVEKIILRKIEYFE